MEPQAAVAQPDEGGMMTVHSATQYLDTVQVAVATALGVPMGHVTVGEASLSSTPHHLSLTSIPSSASFGHGYGHQSVRFWTCQRLHAQMCIVHSLARAWYLE